MYNTKKLLRLATVPVGAILSLLSLTPAFAASSIAIPVITNGFSAPANNQTTISSFITSYGQGFIDIALVLIGLVAVLFLIFYGFQYVTAGGDPEKAKKARGGIINAVIGVIVVALAYTIIQFSINAASAISKVPAMAVVMLVLVTFKSFLFVSKSPVSNRAFVF